MYLLLSYLYLFVANVMVSKLWNGARQRHERDVNRPTKCLECELMTLHIALHSTARSCFSIFFVMQNWRSVDEMEGLGVRIQNLAHWNVHEMQWWHALLSDNIQNQELHCNLAGGKHGRLIHWWMVHNNKTTPDGLLYWQSTPVPSLSTRI